MRQTLKSFALITLGVLVGTGLVWIYLRGNGLQSPVSEPFQRPFLNWLNQQSQVLIAHRGGWLDAPENTLEAFELSAKLSPDIVLWADVRPARDGTLVLFREQDLSMTTNGEGWITFNTYDQLKKLDAAAHFENAQHQNPYAGKGVRIPLLTDVLAHFPKHRFILCFRGNQPGLVEKIIETIDKSGASDRILIMSPENRLLVDLREKRPPWIFGTSLAQMSHLKLFASFGLESVAAIKGDVAVIEPEFANSKSLFKLQPSAIAELHRRKMKIITGPAVTAEDAHQLFASGVDGVLLARPSVVFAPAP